MTTYTLVISGADGDQDRTLSGFPDNEMVNSDVGHVVSAEHPSIAIARGSGDAITFLGAWDYCEGEEPRWTGAE